MPKFITSLAALSLIAGLALAVPATAQQPQANRDQASARQEMRAGRNMPIREIERRIIAQMPGDEYLGFEYDGAASAYRLKFIRDGRVIWVDVDAKTARIVRVAR